MKRAITWILIIVLLVSACSVAAAASYPTLRKGSKGSEVTRLQNALKSLGYYNIAVDGIYGKGTVAAVKTFQSAKGLSVDGVAGPKTLTKLYESAGSGSQAQNTPQPQTGSSSQYATLSSGSKGNAVSALQKKLKALGYYTMSVDGAYGKGTTAAVKAFQSAEGLTANGIADSLTQERLFAKETSQSSASASTTVTTLRLGDSGEAVTQLKNKLWYLGYYTGTLDNRFDDATRTAVIAFQRASTSRMADNRRIREVREQIDIYSSIYSSGSQISTTIIYKTRLNIIKCVIPFINNRIYGYLLIINIACVHVL